MKLSLQIALTPVIIVVMGIITFVKIATKTGAFPTAYLIIWLVVSIVLSGITLRSCLGNNKK
jgi:hypothetical protein